MDSLATRGSLLRELRVDLSRHQAFEGNEVVSGMVERLISGAEEMRRVWIDGGASEGLPQVLKELRLSNCYCDLNGGEWLHQVGGGQIKKLDLRGSYQMEPGAIASCVKANKIDVLKLDGEDVTN
jgi:hypothetical protein